MGDSNYQRTIKKNISVSGIGLHNGKNCTATFKPAPNNTGIHIIRTDLPGNPVFTPTVNNVVDVIRGTTLGQGEARVYTIEHLLSALCGLQIDNLTIELNNSEPPVGDGSAKIFVDALNSSGIEIQTEEKNFFRVQKPFEYQGNLTSIRVEPAEEFEINCEIDYDHPMLRNQHFDFRASDNYEKEIAPAKTYCFDYEIEALKKKGLAKGGSLDNAIIIGPTGIYNPGTFLKFDNEFIRHKILDLMGDLMLLGQPLKGKVIAKRCGHGHNLKFLKQLLQSRDSSNVVPVN